jgi:hypothetical protein
MTHFILSAKAQEWAPLGATWHYSWYPGWGAGSGYVVVESIGDTLIDGKTCSIQSQTIYYNNQDSGYSYGGNQYTFMDTNNIVYHYRYGKFYKLYDFNANVGDYWSWLATEVCNEDSTCNFNIDSTGTTLVDTINLKTFYDKWEFSSPVRHDTVIERIGHNSYLFPLSSADTCNFIAEWDALQLRCYFDNTVGLYETGIAASCDTLTGIKDIVLDENAVKVYPNPASSEINIEMDNANGNNYSIEFYSSIGQKLNSRTINEKIVTLSTKELKDGSYFVLIRKEDGSIGFSKLIEVYH